MSEKEPCDDHDRWMTRCEHCHGLQNGTGTRLAEPERRKDELLDLVREWRSAGRGGTSKSGRTAFLTCADELETLLENEDYENLGDIQ